MEQIRSIRVIIMGGFLGDIFQSIATGALYPPSLAGTTLSWSMAFVLVALRCALLGVLLQYGN